MGCTVHPVIDVSTDRCLLCGETASSGHTRQAADTDTPGLSGQAADALAAMQTDGRGVEYVENATYETLDRLPHGWALCGHCHRVWNDEKSTDWTPAPSARCPFEYEHEYDDED